MRFAATLFALTAAIGVAACSPPEEPANVPETAASSPEGLTPAEPGVGSPPEPGGGVPGSSLQNDDSVNPDGTAADPPLPREDPAT
jgi:hypothetical protein